MHCINCCFPDLVLRNTLFVSFMFAAKYTYYDVWTDTLHETHIFGSSATLTEVLCSSSSNQPQFELMTSRLWTALSCPCDTRLTTELYGIFKRNVHVLPHCLWGEHVQVSQNDVLVIDIFGSSTTDRSITHPKFDLTRFKPMTFRSWTVHFISLRHLP